MAHQPVAPVTEGRRAGQWALNAWSFALVLHLVEIIEDPDGPWWWALRSVVSTVFIAAFVCWLGLWAREAVRRRRAARGTGPL